MVNWEKLTKNLIDHGFAVKRFATAREAAEYINGKLDGKTIGIGGSVSVEELGLYDLLQTHNTVYWNWGKAHGRETIMKGREAQVYLTSVNGLAETGELINIDGTCNRLADTLYGHEEVIFIVGINKIAPDAQAALWRAQNIAAPKNAQRLKKKTPCAVKADKCYDCNSPERLCRGLLTLWRKPGGIPTAEVVLVEEPLGY